MKELTRKGVKGMVMALFIVLLIGAVGTVIIEWQINKSNRSEIQIPVRNEGLTFYRRSRFYRR